MRNCNTILPRWKIHTQLCHTHLAGELKWREADLCCSHTCEQSEPTGAYLFGIPRCFVFRVRIVFTVAFEESPLAEQGDHGVVPGLRRNFACRLAVLRSPV